MFGTNKNINDEKRNSEREEYNTEILEKLLEVTEENNEMLQSLKKSERRANIFRFVYWGFVLSAIFGVFYYLKPLIDFVFQNYATIKDALYNLVNFSSHSADANNIQTILNQLKQ